MRNAEDQLREAQDRIIELNHNAFRLAGGIPEQKLLLFTNPYLSKADMVIAYLLHNWRDFEIGKIHPSLSGRFIFVRSV